MECLLREIPNDYSYKNNYLAKNSNKIEVLFLGSSHIYFGIDPKYLKQKSFNAAYVSQSLNYDLEILKKYRTSWSNLKYIIIPIDYFSMYSTLEDGAEKWRVENYEIYYGIHQSKNYWNNFDFFSGEFVYNSCGRLIKHKLNHESSINCTKFGWGTKNNSKNKNDLTETGKSSAIRHTCKIINNQWVLKNTETIKSFIEFGKQNKTKIIFVTCPAYKSYVENINKNQLNSTINIITQITKNNLNSVYYNFLEDKSFKSGDFYDADHLNEIGARKLTLRIGDIINSEDKYYSHSFKTQ